MDFLNIWCWFFFIPLAGNPVLNVITYSGTIIQGPISVLSTLALVWVCVKYRRNRCRHSLMLNVWNAVQIPPDTLIQPSTAKPLRSQYKSSNLQKIKHFTFYFLFWISTHPYPSTHSVLSLSILTFCCCFPKAVTAILKRKIPIKLQSSVYSSLFNMCIYVCICVIERFTGRCSAHKHVTR